MITQADVDALAALIEKIETAPIEDRSPEMARNLILATTMMDDMFGRYALGEVEQGVDFSELRVWVGKIVVRTSRN